LEQDVESYDQMKNPNYQNHTEVDLGRRDALRQLVLVAIQALGVAALGTRLSWAPEDILTHCAAGITACKYLAKGQREDMALAFSAISTYLPELEAIAKDSSVHRGEATRLVAQCYLLKHVLGLHIENPNVVVARGYAKLALAYSKESGDLLLQLTALKYLTWAYNSDKQYPLALKTIERAQYLIEHGSNSLPTRVCSGIYSTLAVIQAKNGVSALPSLHLAQESFFAPPAMDATPIHHIDLDLGYAQLMRNNGLTYYYAGQYQEALNAFAQVIDPNNLSPKVPMAVRTRVEILTNQTMAALKSPTRDMEQTITCWTASMQGAIALQSQQRFDESCLAYEVMAGIWSGDKRITALRDLTRHW
jgi:tetratricopeptide (TPR) repeat protein